MDIKKADLIRSVIQQLELEVASFQKTINQEKKAIQEAPTARESWSDTTRSQKGSLVEELQGQYNQSHKALSSLKQLNIESRDTIELGALVEIEEGTARLLYLIVPGGGMKVRFGDKVIQLVSIVSPIGRALYRHKAGDIVEAIVPAGIRKLKVLNIS